MYPDKVKHHAAGFIVFFATYFAILLASGGLTIIGKFAAIAAAWLMVRFVAFLKEAIDEAHPETATKDMLDAETTVGGGSLAAALMIAFLLISQP